MDHHASFARGALLERVKDRGITRHNNHRILLSVQAIRHHDLRPRAHSDRQQAEEQQKSKRKAHTL